MCIHIAGANRVGIAVMFSVFTKQIPAIHACQHMLAIPLRDDALASHAGVHGKLSFFCCFLDFAVLGMEPRGSHMLGEGSTRVSLPYPNNVPSVSWEPLSRHLRHGDYFLPGISYTIFLPRRL